MPRKSLKSTASKEERKYTASEVGELLVASLRAMQALPVPHAQPMPVQEPEIRPEGEE